MICPSCSKEFHEDDACPRCGCEIGVLRNIALASDRLAATAAAGLCNGDSTTAIKRAEASWRLKRNGRAARIAALGSVARNDKEEARRWILKSANLFLKVGTC